MAATPSRFVDADRRVDVEPYDLVPPLRLRSGLVVPKSSNTLSFSPQKTTAWVFALLSDRSVVDINGD